MLDNLSASLVKDMCLQNLDWTIIGSRGGSVTIFTGKNRYHAVYGTEGGDPTRENSVAPLPEHSSWFKMTASADHPIICTVIVQDGVAHTLVRHMTPMSGDEAYEDIANLELDRKLIHDEFPEGSWPKDTVEAWRMFHDQIDNMEEQDGVFELTAWTRELVFALSEIQEPCYMFETQLSIKALPEDVRQVRFTTPCEKETEKWWDVRSRSWNDCYIVCTRCEPSLLNDRLMYTIIDRKHNVRVICAELNGGLGKQFGNRNMSVEEKCEKLIQLLSDPNDGTRSEMFDSRNCLRLRIAEYR